jgi:hypothetical protein
MAFAREYGLGVRRDDIFWGQLLAILHNVNRAESTPTAVPLDYMVYHEKPDPTAEEIVAAWRDTTRRIQAGPPT